jgi:hypothetical protein
MATKIRPTSPRALLTASVSLKSHNPGLIQARRIFAHIAAHQAGNLATIKLLCGLWHGATWKFLIQVQKLVILARSNSPFPAAAPPLRRSPRIPVSTSVAIGVGVDYLFSCSSSPSSNPSPAAVSGWRKSSSANAISTTLRTAARRSPANGSANLRQIWHVRCVAPSWRKHDPFVARGHGM